METKNKPKSRARSDEKDNSNQPQILTAVRKLAKECNYEQPHTEQVTRLALHFFDQLRPLHHLPDEDRFLLRCAGLLHDIGWIQGQKGHHKAAMKLILDSPILPFKDHERILIALIARYHRKALPKDSHPLFSQLSKDDKHRIKVLGGILRLADGLDCTHTHAVQSVSCDPGDRQIRVQCKVSHPATAEMEEAGKKSKLLQQALNKKIELRTV